MQAAQLGARLLYVQLLCVQLLYVQGQGDAGACGSTGPLTGAVVKVTCSLTPTPHPVELVLHVREHLEIPGDTTGRVPQYKLLMPGAS